MESEYFRKVWTINAGFIFIAAAIMDHFQEMFVPLTILMSMTTLYTVYVAFTARGDEVELDNDVDKDEIISQAKGICHQLRAANLSVRMELLCNPAYANIPELQELAREMSQELLLIPTVEEIERQQYK